MWAEVGEFINLLTSWVGLVGHVKLFLREFDLSMLNHKSADMSDS